MSRAQVIAVTACLLLNTMDGFDVMIMAFTSVPVIGEWGLSNSALGVLISSGLFGIAAGTLFLPQCADVIGCRNTVILCSIEISAGMILSGLVANYGQLAVHRSPAGIGIRGMIASLNTIVSEHSSDNRKAFVVSVL